MEQAGVNYVKDFINTETNVYKMYMEFTRDNGQIVDFVTYETLINSFPGEWKSILKRND